MLPLEYLGVLTGMTSMPKRYRVEWQIDPKGKYSSSHCLQFVGNNANVMSYVALLLARNSWTPVIWSQQDGCIA